MYDFIISILLSILPGAIYAFIIWITLPYKTFSLRMSYMYMIFGMISITMVSVFHALIPRAYDDMHLIFEKIKKVDVAYISEYSFFQVAATEEISKWITYIQITFALSLFKKEEDKDNPISIMVYCAMVSFGFAILENLMYSITYGTLVMYNRLTTAVLLHLETGLIMGYWLALIKVNNTNSNSILGFVFNKNNRIKKFILTIIAILSAIFVHGLYDFNVYIAGSRGYPLMYTILGLGAFISYICAHHLIVLTKK